MQNIYQGMTNRSVIGLVDTGCSNAILDLKLVPSQYHKPIPVDSQFFAEQMDGTLLKYDTEITKYKFQFYTYENTLTNALSPTALICLRDFHLKHVVFIIGLNFIFGTFHGCSFFPNGFQFAVTPFLTYTYETAKPYNKAIPASKSTCNCDSKSQCNCLIIDYNHLDIDDIDFDILLLDNKLEGFSHNLIIDPNRIYNLLSSENLDIDDIVSKLEKEDIIGENPQLHWTRNTLECKLELIKRS